MRTGKNFNTHHRGGFKILRSVLCLFFVFWLSAPWVGLQIVAWTTMLESNLRTHDFTEAVSQTFDGQHPCPLCKMIAAGKASEKKNAVAPQNQKLEYPPMTEAMILITPPSLSAFSLAPIFAGALPVKPLLPPPRSLFV